MLINATDKIGWSGESEGENIWLLKLWFIRTNREYIQLHACMYNWIYVDKWSVEIWKTLFLIVNVDTRYDTFGSWVTLYHVLYSRWCSYENTCTRLTLTYPICQKQWLMIVYSRWFSVTFGSWYLQGGIGRALCVIRYLFKFFSLVCFLLFHVKGV